MIKYKKKAFTLAEVLITLSIIGIVAALTIPTLINNVQDKEYKTRWKKSYAELDNAVRMLMTNNGGSASSFCSSGSTVETNNCYKNELIKYLNTSTSCDADGSNLNNCLYTSSIRYLNGYTTSSLNHNAGVVLTNGSMLSVRWTPSNPYSAGPIVGNSYGIIQIDTNGAKEPNQYGKDVFNVHITEIGIKPYGTKGDSADSLRDYSRTPLGCDLNIHPDAFGDTCAADCLIDDGRCITTKTQ